MKTKILIATVFAVFGGTIGLWKIGKSRSFQLFGVIVPRVNISEKIVALTFDDGPSTSSVDELLGVLAKRNIVVVGRILQPIQFEANKAASLPASEDVELARKLLNLKSIQII